MDSVDLLSLTDLPGLGPATVLRTEQTTQMQGLLLNSQWGSGVAVSDGISAVKLLEFEFVTEYANLEIWVEFASLESRPVTLLIDGLPIMTAALSTTTSGWHPEHQIWRRQISLALDAGRHIIGFSRDRGGFPHVRRIALLPVANIAALEQPMIALERRVGKRTCELDSAEFNDLASVAVPLLRRLIARRRSPETILSALRELSTAVAHNVNSPQDQVGFSGPFNGQRQRQALFNRLDAALGFDVFVETGAYLGTTTEMLATLGRPVFSCELYRDSYVRSLVRLTNFSNLKLYNSDSRIFLTTICGANPDWKMPFFYLDAHWSDDIPLPEEIKIISEHFSEFVIFVDDFQHPDAGYGYDRYENGAELSLSYLVPRLETQVALEFLVSSVPANAETGAKRGTLILVPTRLYRDVLASEPLLMRPYSN